MKRLLIIIIIFIIFGIVAGREISQFSARSQGSVIQNTPSISTITPTPAPTAGIPTTLNIPSIDVSTTVEQVGLDAEKRMDVPKDFMNVGWYMYGIRPGEIGNAVMDGHVDTPTGAPSVFANLHTIQNGDLITVIDDTDRTHTFRVTKTQNYALADVPLKEIFGKADQPNLILITCGGTWDTVSKNYSHRTITYATLNE